MPGDDVYAWSGSPPPYLQQDEGSAASLTLYAFTQSAPHNHQASPSVTVLHFRERASRQVRYAITIPKKREGWKAEVSFVTEKERTQVSTACVQPVETGRTRAADWHTCSWFS